MIDAVAISILMKAIDFVFEEGKKILEERRERRKLVDNSQYNNNSVSDTSNVDTIHTKEVALSSVDSIDPIVFGKSELDEMNHLLSLLGIYKKNYYLAKEQYEIHGSAYVPPVIVHNLSTAEDGISKTTQDLQNLLSRIYGKKVMATGNT